jgi:hypothetical protein
MPRDPDSSNLAGSTPFQNARVRNNTVYYTNAGGGAGITVSSSGSGHVVASNAVAFAASGSTGCFSLPLGSGAYALLGDNACGPGGTWGNAPVPPGRVTSDPLFTNPGALDFTIGRGSPLVAGGSADPVGHAADDITGKPRDPSQPGAGAYAP